MGREIKFRVFDMHTKRLSGPEGLNVSIRNGVIEHISCHFDESGHSEWGSATWRLAQIGFATAWNLINGKKYPWESNPYVWVIEFQKQEATKQK